MSANHQNTLVCWKTKDALCLQDFFVALTIQELELSQKSRCQKEKWEQTAREIFSIFMYAGKKKSRLEKRNQKKPTPWDADFIPAEKLTTGKKRPSMLKFSNIPWTGWPFIRKDMLGALRSKQQLMTSSVLNRCWLGEFTVRATQPMEVTETHLVKLLKTALVFTAA